MTRTYIKGKDEALEVSIEKMQTKLKQLGFDIEEVLWLNPVSNIYSVNIQDKNCSLLFTNGKGSTRNACLASALGEFFERLNCNYFFADFYLGQAIANSSFVHYPDEKWFSMSTDTLPDGLLNDSLWTFYDPEHQLTSKMLIDTNSGNVARGICAIPFVHYATHQICWFPVNLLGNLYVSNGMSAGNTMMEARTQALSEILERYIKNRIIAERISLPLIPEHIIELYPNVGVALDELKRSGFQVEIKDASLGGLYPLINVTMTETESGRCLASFGAHPSFEVALDRTLTELLQGRRLDSLDGFQTPSFDDEAVADVVNLETHFIDSSGLISYDFFKADKDYDFVYWDFDNSTKSEYEFLVKIIEDEGWDIYIAEYEHLGIYGCRILVPGMSEIYPLDELNWQNNNEGVALRESLLSLSALTLDQSATLLKTLEQSGYSDHSDVCGLIGIAADPGSVWESLRIGELKGMLALYAQDYEQAIEWGQWCLELGQLSTAREIFYRALIALLEIRINPHKQRSQYSEGLETLYGSAVVSRAESLIDGKSSFDGLFDAGLSLRGFERHQSLLAAYEKLQQAKKMHWEFNNP
jgi:ribosomal protein S12 methylthiotransferase accessory factor